MTETIKISVPENIADITLDQYVKFEALRAREDKMTEQGMIERVISLFTGMKKQDVKNYQICLMTLNFDLNYRY